jgi:hypothetical protein
MICATIQDHRRSFSCRLVCVVLLTCLTPTKLVTENVRLYGDEVIIHHVFLRAVAASHTYASGTDRERLDLDIIHNSSIRRKRW